MTVFPTDAKRLGALLLALCPLAALAEGGELGQREFANSCAQCHGAGGEGDGVMMGFLSTRAPDLTALQRNNGGVFPVSRLYQVIEGGSDPGPHGTSNMPAWGDRYDAQVPSQLGEMYTPADREAFVRGRILALIEHISTLQKE